MEENTEKMTFDQFKLNKQLLNAVSEVGYVEPTDIQKKAIPRALAGQDILGIAQTGTGKTAAFVLPMLMKIKYAQGEAPRGLIIAPTRELVLQISEHTRQLAAYTDLRVIGAYGGVGMRPQQEELRQGIDIIVATPGRFWDLYKTGDLITKKIQIMVLDEADRMMDMGFMPQINMILEIIPRKRQNLLFSATMPERMVQLTENFLAFPERIEVTPQATTVETIEQSLYYVDNFRTKANLLLKLLEDPAMNRVMVFVRKRTNAENLHKFVDRHIEEDVKAIHANKGQNTRLNSFEAFRNGEVRVLVSTDVASRGIDISMVSHVVNFDVPAVYEDYVHRVGRTGRAKNTGIALTFCNPAEKYHLKRIEKLIQREIKILSMPSDVEIVPTPREEKQVMAIEIDKQKRRDDPTFKGAFHEKKKKNDKKNKPNYDPNYNSKASSKRKGRKNSKKKR